MAALWVLVTFTVAAVFAFQNSIGFAVTFLGTCWLPCFVVGTAKWGLMRGDRSQKVVVPIIAAVVLAFAYWLSTKVEVPYFWLSHKRLRALDCICLDRLDRAPVDGAESGEINLR